MLCTQSYILVSPTENTYFLLHCFTFGAAQSVWWVQSWVWSWPDIHRSGLDPPLVLHFRRNFSLPECRRRFVLNFYWILFMFRSLILDYTLVEKSCPGLSLIYPDWAFSNWKVSLVSHFFHAVLLSHLPLLSGCGPRCVCVCVSVREWQLAECRRQGLSLVSHDSLMKSSGRVGTEGGGQKRGMWGHKGRERHCGGRMGQRFLHQKRKQSRRAGKCKKRSSDAGVGGMCCGSLGRVVHRAQLWSCDCGPDLHGTVSWTRDHQTLGRVGIST